MISKILIFITLLIGLLNTASIAHAEEKALSSLSYKVITQAQELLTNNQPKEAIKKIRPLLSKIKDKPYDQAVAFQMLGFAFYEVDDKKNAKAAFAKSIKLNELPIDVQRKLLFNLTKIYSLDSEHKQAKTYLEKWLETAPTIDADGYLLSSMVYYNLEDYKSMIPYLKSAIKLKNNPPINWYELLGSAYIQLKQYKNAANIYETIIKQKPSDKQLWLQLASIYQLAKDDKKSLAIYELTHKKGLLDEKQIINLANNYNYHKMPYKAGLLLENELKKRTIKPTRKTIKLIANSWILAQEPEKAIAALNNLNKTHPNTETSYQLGQLYYQTEQWDKAISALENVIDDKKFKQRPKAFIILGIAAYENNNFKLSEQSFKRALAYEQTKHHAETWLKQISSIKKANS